MTARPLRVREIGVEAARLEGRMAKRVIVSGLLGFVVLALCAFVSNAVFYVATRTEMNRVAEERVVYQFLKERITEPAVYLVNPALTKEGAFPAGEPVFSISYAGFGHEGAGRMALVQVGIGLASALLAALLLSLASVRVLSRYALRVLFVSTIGLLIAVCADMGRHGIGGYPLHSTLLLVVDRLASWILVGLAMAWPIRSPTGVPTRRRQQQRAA